MTDTHHNNFLEQLARLPLVGGSIALIGQPTGVAARPTVDMLEAYKTWLDNERRCLSVDMAADPDCQQHYRTTPRTMDEAIALARHIDTVFKVNTPAWTYHANASSPFDRAALVLSAAGCGWKRVGNKNVFDAPE